MIAGEILSFKNTDETRSGSLLIELTDTNADDKYIELGFDHGKERIYIQFRMSDLVREIKEAKD